MKLRLESNSVRFRLKRSDLLQLQEHNYLETEIVFPGGSFVYALRINDIAGLQPELAHNRLVIHIPVVQAEHWMHTDATGIYALLNIGEDKALDIIIEKDFPCKSRPSEDKSDVFTELAEKSGNKCDPE